MHRRCTRLDAGTHVLVLSQRAWPVHASNTSTALERIARCPPRGETELRCFGGRVVSGTAAYRSDEISSILLCPNLELVGARVYEKHGCLQTRQDCPRSSIEVLLARIICIRSQARLIKGLDQPLGSQPLLQVLVTRG